MSRTYKDSNKGSRRRQDRRISVRAVPKDQPDLRKLSRALIQLAMAQAEAEAQQTAAGPTVQTNPQAERSNAE